MKCINYRCLEHYDECEDNGCNNLNDIEDCDCLLTAQKDAVADVPLECGVMPSLSEAAQSLFDNRLGWSDGRPPYAPTDFWINLGAALYGEDDPRVKELQEGKKA